MIPHAACALSSSVIGARTGPAQAMEHSTATGCPTSPVNRSRPGKPLGRAATPRPTAPTPPASRPPTPTPPASRPAAPTPRPPAPRPTAPNARRCRTPTSAGSAPLPVTARPASGAAVDSRAIVDVIGSGPPAGADGAGGALEELPQLVPPHLAGAGPRQPVPAQDGRRGELGQVVDRPPPRLGVQLPVDGDHDRQREPAGPAEDDALGHLGQPVVDHVLELQAAQPRHRALVSASTSPGSPAGTGWRVRGSTTRSLVRVGTGRPRSRVVGCRSAWAATDRRVKNRNVSGPVSVCPQPCIHSGRRRLLACRNARTVDGCIAS